MRALIPVYLRNLPLWLSVAIWLAVFLIPTGYCVLLAIVARSRVPAPPESLVVVLLSLILMVPVAALLVCGNVVWLSKLNLRWRVGWLGLTVLAILLQCGVRYHC